MYARTQIHARACACVHALVCMYFRSHPWMDGRTQTYTCLYMCVSVCMRVPAYDMCHDNVHMTVSTCSPSSYRSLNTRVLRVRGESMILLSCSSLLSTHRSRCIISPTLTQEVTVTHWALQTSALLFEARANKQKSSGESTC